jgi:ketosteroid isomerase-like protein
MHPALVDGTMSISIAPRAQKGVHRKMRRSAEVRDALLRFYEVFPAGDLEDFAQIIVRENEGVVVIGTDPAQWTEGREQWIAAREAVVHEMEGLRLEAGEEPHCYEEGSMGWVADRPRVVLPDGNAISTRLTGVVRREEGEWRLVHIHISVGVPDEEVAELQKRWSS